jgi:hypothetical protein
LKFSGAAWKGSKLAGLVRRLAQNGARRSPAAAIPERHHRRQADDPEAADPAGPPRRSARRPRPVRDRGRDLLGAAYRLPMPALPRDYPQPGTAWWWIRRWRLDGTWEQVNGARQERAPGSGAAGRRPRTRRSSTAQALGRRKRGARAPEAGKRSGLCRRTGEPPPPAVHRGRGVRPEVGCPLQWRRAVQRSDGRGGGQRPRLRF